MWYPSSTLTNSNSFPIQNTASVPYAVYVSSGDDLSEKQTAYLMSLYIGKNLNWYQPATDEYIIGYSNNPSIVVK